MADCVTPYVNYETYYWKSNNFISDKLLQLFAEGEMMLSLG